MKTKELVSRAIRPFIGKKEDAPQYIQDNEYIETGYRIEHTSCFPVTKSLCTVHNESVNVWTHMLGSLCFFGLMIGLSVSVFPKRFETGH